MGLVHRMLLQPAETDIYSPPKWATVEAAFRVEHLQITHQEQYLEIYEKSTALLGMGVPPLGTEDAPRLAGTYIHGFESQAHCYWHLVLNVCARIIRIPKEFKHYPVLVWHKTPAQFFEYYRRMGFTGDLVPVSDAVKPDVLIYPTKERNNPFPRKSTFPAIRELFIKNDAPTERRTRKLYIARSDTVSRKVTNESELFKALAGIGFQYVENSSYSIQQQADLFNEAKAVISPHGSGLVNLIYAQPGTRVLELLPTSCPNGCFWPVADSMRQDYMGLKCPNAPDAPRRANFCAPVPAIVEWAQRECGLDNEKEA